MEKNKKQIISIFAISLVLLATALVSADCKISFTSKINDYPGANFEAGIINGATDNYDPLYDVLQVGMPAGKYIQMATIINDNPLAKDFRSDATSKKYQIMKIAVDSDSEGLTGTDALAWTINCPDNNIQLSLVDYGTDATRTNVIKTINLRQLSSYNTEVSNVLGPYRYLDLLLNKATTCTENWQCIDWSKCTNGKQTQTRTCTDLNKCNTTTNKPATTQVCCIENWKCTSWSKCVNGKQTRTCTDSNKCGITTNKPAETQSCKKTSSASSTTSSATNLQTTTSSNTPLTTLTTTSETQSSGVINLNQPAETTANSNVIHLNQNKENKSLFQIIKDFFAGLF